MVARNGKARLVGVVGDPITHSLSPAIHEFWLQQYNINGAYVPLRISADAFRGAVPILAHAGFVGFNVTLPHKQEAYLLADTHDKASQSCKAVNTLVVQHNGTFHGMNSDAYGFTQMMQALQAVDSYGLEHVLVMGAGGAARAVVYALQHMGCKHITIANRSLDNAHALVSDLGLGEQCRVVALDNMHEAVRSAHLVVNTLSIGSNIMQYVDDTLHHSSDDCMIVDISYGRKGTPVTQLAGQLGRRNADGLLMLLWQAVPGFEQWFGILPSVDESVIRHVSTMIAS